MINKNDRLIFEGDLVKYHEYELPFTVVFKSCYFELTRKDLGKTFCSRMRKEYWDFYEVVGNIYDNPELYKNSIEMR